MFFFWGWNKRTGRSDGSLRSGPGHFPVDGPPVAKVPEDHAPAAAPHGRVHPPAPGHLPQSRPLRPRLCRKVPGCLARHAGITRPHFFFYFILFFKKSGPHFSFGIPDVREGPLWFIVNFPSISFQISRFKNFPTKCQHLIGSQFIYGQ